MLIVPITCVNGVGTYAGKSLPVKTVYGNNMTQIGTFFGVEVNGEYQVLYDRVEAKQKTLKAIKTINNDTYTLEVDVDTCGQVINATFTKDNPPVPNPNKKRIVIYEREVKWDEGQGTTVTIDRELGDFTATYIGGDEPGFYATKQRIKKYKNYMEMFVAYFPPDISNSFRHTVRVNFGYYIPNVNGVLIWTVGTIDISNSVLAGNSIIDDNPDIFPYGSVKDDRPNDDLWYPFYIRNGARADVFGVNS